MYVDPKEKITRRAAQEVLRGQIINLGIGLPTYIPNYLEPDMQVTIHSENGILGAGENVSAEHADRNLIDSGGAYISTIPGASFCDSALSFALVRGGRLDITFLGTLEVAENGDLANWIIPGRFAPGIGGAMELAQKAKRLIITTTHTTKKGAPKILERCTLPLTAKGCVDMIITELAVFRITEAGMVLQEIAAGTDLETVRRLTTGKFTLAEDISSF